MNELGSAPPEAADRSKMKAVFTIIENQGRGGNRDRKFWLRLGVGFINKDGSMNVRLDAMPVNGMLHIRDMPAADETRGRRDGEGGGYDQKFDQKGNA